MTTSSGAMSVLATADPLRGNRAQAYVDSLDHDAILAAALHGGDTLRHLPRSAQARRAQTLLAFAAIALLIAAAASAVGFGLRPTIDFFTAKKGPSWSFVSLERFQKIASLELGRKLPSVQLAAPARQVGDVKYDGRDHVLVVAPVKGGGYCYSWRGPYLGAECRIPQNTPLAIDAHLPGDASGPIALYGTFTPRNAAKLEIRYQDGSSSVISAVWVSAPINAGFFLYQLPAENRRPGHEPLAVELVGSNGQVLDIHRLPVQTHIAHTRYTIPGYGTFVLPSDALFAKRTQLFATTVTVTLRGTAHTAARTQQEPVGLWVAPRRGGGSCYWYGSSNIGVGVSSGCTTAAASLRPPFLGADFVGDKLCCWAGAKVSRVELRYQDGTRIELKPKQGYLLYALPTRQYAVGHRLTEIVAYNQPGAVIWSRTLPTDKPGLYPCARPTLKIDGVRFCR